MYLVGFPILIGFLVTVHELGHYLVGRWFGVKAEAFSVGFGREIAGYTDQHGTRWKLSLLPLGGYVQFKGDMNPASVPDQEALASADAAAQEGSFHHASLWKRTLIVAAGPVTNILVALAIFFAFFAINGKPVVEFAEDSTKVAGFAEISVARDAGVELGDTILAIDGDAVADFSALVDKVALYPGKSIVMTLDRDGRSVEIPVTIGSSVETDTFGNQGTVGRLGIMRPDDVPPTLTYEDVGVLGAIPLAVSHSIDIFKMMLTGIGQIISGDRSLQELGGPIKIAKFSGEQLSLGLLAFVNFAALISLNLAFINLLPIPALDGGHLAFYAAEAVRRKPVGPQATEWAYRTGIFVVLLLMVFVTINDLVSLPLFGS
jgi:regulator of sigma E protease